MALDIPIDSPLTPVQAELTAKIGSMKNLLAIPTNININLPKAKQISTFDYLVKVLKAVGVEPDFLLRMFIEKVFDETTEFLEEKVLMAIASSLASKGKDISSGANIQTPVSESEQKRLKEANYTVLKNNVPANFLTTAKKYIVRELTRMIFGPTNKIGQEDPAISQADRDYLRDNVICGAFMFSVSNDPIVRNEDIEFNRIQLKKQLDSGNIEFQISCQDVKIKLPENPTYIFEGSGTNGYIPSTPVTPSQSLFLLVEYVEAQTQNINNQNNSNKAGKSFLQILAEKLISYISTLVVPYLGPPLAFLNSFNFSALLFPNGITKYDIASGPCDIQSNQSDEDKKSFAKELLNELYKTLLNILLITAIREFKKFVIRYYEKTAKEKIKRKAEKIKQRFKILERLEEGADRVQRLRTAASGLSSILSDALEFSI